MCRAACGPPRPRRAARSRWSRRPPPPEAKAACLPASLQAAGLRLRRCVACPPAAGARLPGSPGLAAACSAPGGRSRAARRRRPPGREGESGTAVQEAAAVRFRVGEGRLASRESRQGKGYASRSTMDRPIGSFTIHYWLWAWAFTVSLDS